MTVDQHISDLLYRYECVILPNFGAFITQTESARVDDTTNAFYPPRKVISFNSQLKGNDGLLVSHIATTEKTSYHAASAKVESFVKTIEANLAKSNPISLYNIGTIRSGEENRLLFEPSYNTNYLASSFGLASYTSAEVTRAVSIENEVTAQDTTTNAKPVVALSQAARTNRPYLKYAAVGLLALGVTGALSVSYYSKEVKAHNLAEQQKADAQLEAKIQEATFFIDTPLQPVTLTSKTLEGNYHIVAGAFRVEANANKKISQLKELGFEARAIGKNKYGLHQVVYASYIDRLEALKALRDIKRNQNSGAWLLVQDLD